MDEIISAQLVSERDGGEGNLEWGGVMEECKRELSCVCIKMPKPLVGNLRHLVGRMPLNLVSRGRRR